MSILKLSVLITVPATLLVFLNSLIFSQTTYTYSDQNNTIISRKETKGGLPFTTITTFDEGTAEGFDLHWKPIAGNFLFFAVLVTIVYVTYKGLRHENTRD